MSLDQLRDALRQFAAARQWEQFHTPRNLVLALGGELGELMELIQWRTDADVAALVADPAGQRAIADELADVLIYLVRLADVLDIDLLGEATRKLSENDARYPPDEVRGRSDKRAR